jgi:hypothetical protein
MKTIVSRLHLLAAFGVLAAAALTAWVLHATDAPSGNGASTAAKANAQNAAISTKGKSIPAAEAAKAAAARHRMLDSAVSNVSGLPPKGTQLKSILAELKARAADGDADAAARLFSDLSTCAQVQRLSQMMPGMANNVLNNNAMNAQRQNRMLDMVQRDLDFTQDNAAMCAGLNSDDMASLVPATLQAAQTGDAQAANCYVGANLNNWPGLLDNPQWIQDYQSNALGLATSALQQGDWAMAQLMAQAYNGNSRNMLNQVTGTNATQAYTYAMLMSLGQPSGAQTSQRTTNNLNNLSSQLTPDQIQAANAQAQQMYQQYFNSTPRQTGEVSNEMQACQSGGPPGG